MTLHAKETGYDWGRIGDYVFAIMAAVSVCALIASIAVQGNAEEWNPLTLPLLLSGSCGFAVSFLCVMLRVADSIHLRTRRHCEQCGGQLSEVKGWAGFVGEYGYYRECIGDTCASAEVEALAPGRPPCGWSTGYSLEAG